MAYEMTILITLVYASLAVVKYNHILKVLGFFGSV